MNFIIYADGVQCEVLSIELSEEVYIPWPPDLQLAITPYVDEVVGVVTKDSAYGEWLLPWGESLCMPFLSWANRRTRSPSWKVRVRTRRL